MALHCGGRFVSCFLNESTKDWHLGGWLVCDYRSYALRGLVEAWQGKGGFDPLGLIVFFALKMKFSDGFNGALI